ncbi:hypothetical protein GGR51DRAFT_23055 [Nemania sp. FL0031]|nr:hypothetical protein GGR51DRAFT_23055 [Nemania sp. FL0031]
MSTTSATPQGKINLQDIIDKHRPQLDEFEEIYKKIHSNPELGTHEEGTAALASEHLKTLGFEVTTGIGGHGVIGTFRNGDGMTLMLRADMDALPILENTGVPYASRVVFKDADGTEKPVMHACGHDMHVTTLMAVAKLLKTAANDWSGTLTCVFQPNEENGAGAMAMFKGEPGRKLYDYAPLPDLILAQHVDHRRNGNIAIRAGPCESAADSFLVTVYGKGGHASKPESCIDPIVMGCHMVVRLQSIVSRLVAPQDEVVLTCGSFHGGDAHNNIPDFVKFKINVRTYNDNVRAKVLDAIRKIIYAEADAVGAKQPDIERTHKYPLTDNDSKHTAELRSLFIQHFGEGQVEEMEKLAGSEDFPNLALGNNAPYVIWFWGATAVEKYDKAVQDKTLDSLPQIHSAEFCPSIRPTLEVGLRAMSLAALSYLTRK